MLAVLFSALFAVACGDGASTAHTHIASTAWQSDEDGHYRVCIECGERLDESPHLGGNATCTEKGVCEVCKTVYGEYGAHAYTQVRSDETTHWTECLCGAMSPDGKTPHEGGNATCQAQATCEICHTAYGGYGVHEYTVLAYDENYHWKVCVCGEIDETSMQLHRGGTATCTEKAVCEDCDRVYGRYGAHEYTVLASDENYHWKVCVCGEIDPTGKSMHSGGEATCIAAAHCTVCDTPYGALGAHSGGEATCTALAICLRCSQPYGTLKNHTYTIVNHDEQYCWLECACGAIDEDSKMELEVDVPPTEGGTADETPTTPETTDEENEETPTPEEEETQSSALQGSGTDKDPYVLAKGQTVNLQIVDSSEKIYFQYAAATDVRVSFSDANNVDASSIQYGDAYYLQYVGPTNISLEGGAIYVFALYPSSVGALSFTFTVES